MSQLITHWKPVVDSTNSWAKRFANSNSDTGIPHLFIANYQTAGRGRLGRKWISPPKSGALMSILHRLPLEIKDTPWLLGQCAAYVVITALSEYKVMARFKWPNDVWTPLGKICGILPEGIWQKQQAYLIVGIGVNLNTETFPKSIQATSVKKETGKGVNPTQFSLSIAKMYLSTCLTATQEQHQQILRFLDSIHLLKGKIATWHGRTVVVEHIDTTDGGLIVRILTSGEKRKLTWGELLSIENGEP